MDKDVKACLQAVSDQAGLLITETEQKHLCEEHQDKDACAYHLWTKERRVAHYQRQVKPKCKF